MLKKLFLADYVVLVVSQFSCLAGYLESYSKISAGFKVITFDSLGKDC